MCGMQTSLKSPLVRSDCSTRMIASTRACRRSRFQAGARLRRLVQSSPQQHRLLVDWWSSAAAFIIKHQAKSRIRAAVILLPTFHQQSPEATINT
ncbi:hypothetical protein PtA15_7A502 [Puccinia triticina]|uniref:HAT C-terminal dimerisation domain-containing protein n=1 Tax=Puccinia triticina TaxID=208348 RepID=A0ABY7CR24_9BASI|nr:uncharacterized protein PtA15_7A502 [Puccinia triticina]WAQ86773.1 hypothetical protein PtA15_7A502 [Puccinia triticina]